MYGTSDKERHFILFVGVCLIVVSAYPKTVTAGPPNKNHQLIQQLFENYNADFRPPGQNGSGSTIVTINLFMRSISAIDHKLMLYKTQLTFRMQWFDARLQFEEDPDLRFLTVPKSLRDKVWKPDLFFSNEIASQYHDLLERNEYFRIFPNGEVLYSTRISLTLSCPMVLRQFPFDKQTCSLRMASYGYTTDDITFVWKKVDPVQVTSDLHLPNFALEKFTPDNCDSQSNTGVWSCLRIDLIFTRESSRYIKEYFIPEFIAVLLVWLSLWLHPLKHAVPRALILMASFLYFEITVSKSQQEIPAISYTSIMDCWNSVCFVFLIVPIVEFVLVNYLGNKHADSVAGGNQGSQSVKDILVKLHLQSTYDNIQKEGWHCTIDFLTRIVHFVAFVIFLVWCLISLYG